MRFLLSILVGLCLVSNLRAADIAMVSLAVGDNFRNAVSLGIQNKQSYCDEHGYDFICEDELLDHTRTAHWSKILLILKTMENSNYKWIFWTDADALISNRSRGQKEKAIALCFADEQWPFLFDPRDVKYLLKFYLV